MHPSKQILISPLNWGLGHAARCIPVIQELMVNKHNVILAADGKVKCFLQKEFPTLEIIDIPSSTIKYASGSFQVWKICMQLPKFISGIRKEHRALIEIIRKKKIDIVISDNRYGLWNKNVYSIFITHQLMIKLPGSWKTFENMVHRMILKKVRKFDECWIPDVKEGCSLSGDLSHAYPLPDNTLFIGPLSRFSLSVKTKPEQPENDILVVLSGPEPQRTILEEKLIKQFTDTPYRVKIVRGIPGTKQEEKTGNIVRISFLETSALYEEIKKSNYIIARAGYTTIMDLLYLQKKAILIPTPGQTEQEYLAQHLHTFGFLHFVKQKHLTIIENLKQTDSFIHSTPSYDFNTFKITIARLNLI